MDILNFFKKRIICQEFPGGLALRIQCCSGLIDPWSGNFFCMPWAEEKKNKKQTNKQKNKKKPNNNLLNILNYSR